MSLDQRRHPKSAVEVIEENLDLFGRLADTDLPVAVDAQAALDYYENHREDE
ncbi:hypothetical protein [Haloferax mucosum]|uniref:hypothetical protein n=1 Tax=Haloferax mucosum TaxID=403181 RepID=UPI00032671CD|nr:hypothetical protein [Haloferax mucosum]